MGCVWFTTCDTSNPIWPAIATFKLKITKLMHDPFIYRLMGSDHLFKMTQPVSQLVSRVVSSHITCILNGHVQVSTSHMIN